MARTRGVVQQEIPAQPILKKKTKKKQILRDRYLRHINAADNDEPICSDISSDVRQ